MHPTLIWRRVACGLIVAVAALSPGRATACFSDADCDDGLFCTVDHCTFFFCTHDARDCNDFNGCTQDSCDETHNVCVHEPMQLAQCEDFNIFTTNEVCCGATCEGVPLLPVVIGQRCCVSTE